MSGELRVNNITDEAGTGSPDFPNGVDAGVLTGTLPAIDGSNLTGISSYTDSDALDLFNASGSAPVYACRAWVNFDGTGTVSINGSGNVSSITDNGTGNYTLNFTTAMPDSNYSAAFAHKSGGGSISSESSRTTTSLTLITSNQSASLLNRESVSASIFR